MHPRVDLACGSGDRNGRQTSITDPLGHVMSFGYDTLGRMTSYTDKRGNTVLYTFDENGRELTRTNRNGEVLTRTYDAAGRLATMTSSRRAPDGESVVLVAASTNVERAALPPTHW